MIIYVDITQLEKGRANTGIQRVVKEFLKRTKSTSGIVYKIIIYNEITKNVNLLDNEEVELFLKDTQNYQFKNKTTIDIFTIKPTTLTALLDMDSNWNIELKREKLYPILKENGFKIFNFIYDLIPILLPQYAHEVTANNFESYIKAIFNHSDLVMFDSQSALNDFLKIKKEHDIQRDIPTRAIGLGSDFIKSNTEVVDIKIKNILDKKYILFVGTLEPRKNQETTLDVFTKLSEKYDDLNLVIIGRKGWKIDHLLEKIENHPLKNRRVFWLDNISDDELSHFYQNAFLVTYLSKYEGYGLPIAESLSYANITITSKNSSMYEVGRDFADYVVYDSFNELESLITLYIENQELYRLKKEAIRNSFKTTSWDQFYHSISSIFINYQKSIEITQSHLKKLQFVFISIDKHNLEGTIAKIDEYADFVKEYIVVTNAKCLDDFKQIKSKNKITLIDEDSILKEHKENFSKKDHQSKNWLLRVSLLNIEMLDAEFIMLDDDNRPLRKIDISTFITDDGRYNCFYFYDLLNWNNLHTDYDKGQHKTKDILTKLNYELLSYSSHSPQIINKEILKEVSNDFFQIGLNNPIDEWSIYFNYGASLYPNSFSKKRYETLNWPANPTDWDLIYSQEKYTFENYYKELYDEKERNYSDSTETKVKQHLANLSPFLDTKEIFKANTEILSKNNMVHQIASFKTKDIEIYILAIPYFIIVKPDSDLKLQLNYKVINKTQKTHDVSLDIFLDGQHRARKELARVTLEAYQESIVEFPISSINLEQFIYDITFNIMIDNSYLYEKDSPYLMKLIVSDEPVDKLLDYPKLIGNDAKEKTLKDKIKAIPALGFLTRWIYNILRINNIKHNVYMQQNQLNVLTQQLQQQSQQMQQQLQQQSQQIEALNSTIKQQVSKEILFQSLSFGQRIDQFIFDAKIDMKNSNSSVESLEKLPRIFTDDYYLAFENKFRGSREEISLRMKEYFAYLDLKTIEKSLDIGCGRAEWVELLQQKGIEAYGIDMNFSMIQEAKKHNISNLQTTDALKYLSLQKDNSLDLITAFHVIEHIPFETLLLVVKEIYRVLKPQGQLLLETPNPENLLVASYTFYKDPTHLNPLPSEVISFMLDYLTFQNIKVTPLHPFPSTMHLKENTQSANFINESFLKAQDYIITATK
ncbi:MAG: glycosyltransferase [Sulfurimonas sp.]|nr:glycosyltransferase [Sulfurimonas sp.]MDD3835371.1 glycosyltransferase [Sulfurimonas sp.]